MKQIEEVELSLSPSEQLEYLKAELLEQCQTLNDYPQIVDTTKLRYVFKLLDELVPLLSVFQQFDLAGEVFLRLSEALLSRTDHALHQWEQRYHLSEPTWTDDLANFLDELTIKTTDVDTHELVLPIERAPYPAGRRSPTEPEPEMELEPEVFPQDEDHPLSANEIAAQIETLAHDEDIGRWSTTVFGCLKQSDDCSLVDLIEQTGYPLAQVWLTLLLSQNSGYTLVQSSADDFYNLAGIRVQPVSD